MMPLSNSIHTHCLDCYRTTCTNDCPIIQCPQFCSHSFHQCKSKDHLLVCSKTIVPCLNVFYGCPFVFPRHKINSHLCVCPASVVHCSFKWNRTLLSNTKAPIKHCTFETPVVIPQMDIALTLKDQKSKVLEGINNYSNMTKVFKLNLDMEREDRVGVKRMVEVERDNEGSNELLKIEEQPGKIVISIDSNYNAHPLSGNFQSNNLSFSCDEVFRRDDFSQHFRNFHSEIQAWSDHWIDQRCPVSSYGCTFSRSRLKPQGSILIFDTELYQLRVPPECCNTHPLQQPSIYFSKNQDLNFRVKPAENSESTTTFNLLALPQLILDRILSYTDTYTLRNISLVSVRCRQMCAAVVKRRGMVELRWGKVTFLGLSGWKIIAQAWKFPNGFSSIERWEFSKDEPMSNHMSSCPFYVRNTYNKPIPLLFANSEMPKFDYDDGDDTQPDDNI